MAQVQATDCTADGVDNRSIYAVTAKLICIGGPYCFCCRHRRHDFVRNPHRYTSNHRRTYWLVGNWGCLSSVV